MDYEKREYEKRANELVLIASENYPSQAVLDASGSIFQLKYAEGFPKKRYYCGCEIVDEMEQECIDTCLKLFNAEDDYYANVQANSGASANLIVYNAVLEPNDTVLALDVKGGGHISHSHPKSILAKYHNVIPYTVNADGLLDYDEIERLAIEYRPKLIVCGASNYSREIDFKRFGQIRDKVNEFYAADENDARRCYLMCDIAHISILVAHGLHQSPIGVADFVTSTTHKCLKGPRGAFILYKKEFDKQIRLSTIPGIFGGALMQQVYAKLVCFKEALTLSSRDYSARIITNAKAMASAFASKDIPLVAGGTDNHLMTIDLTNFNVSGKQLADTLAECGLITNCNAVPNDKRSFFETSGVRIGTPAITARGLDGSDCFSIGLAISDLIYAFNDNADIEKVKSEISSLVMTLTNLYPLSQIYTR